MEAIAAPPPAPAPSKPIRVGGQITPPRLLHRVNPGYPPLARCNSIEGVVILEATVGTDGPVEDLRVLRSHSLLAESALEAVRQITASFPADGDAHLQPRMRRNRRRGTIQFEYKT